MSRPKKPAPFRVYPVNYGTAVGFVVADRAGWLPGVFPTRAAAERAGKGRGRTPRTRANFPRMKDRAYARREGPVVSWGGGMYCPCGARITWGKVRAAEYAEIEQIIDNHSWCDNGDDYDLTDEEGDWICEHTRPELWAEGRALVAKIHERKALTVQGFTIETDMTLPPGNAFVVKDGKQVGWIEL